MVLYSSLTLETMIQSAFVSASQVKTKPTLKSSWKQIVFSWLLNMLVAILYSNKDLYSYIVHVHFGIWHEQIFFLN